MKPPDETSNPAADYSTANSATYNESSFDYGCPTLGTMWRYQLEWYKDMPETVDLPEAEWLEKACARTCKVILLLEDHSWFAQ